MSGRFVLPTSRYCGGRGAGAPRHDSATLTQDDYHDQQTRVSDRHWPA